MRVLFDLILTAAFSYIGYLFYQESELFFSLLMTGFALLFLFDCLKQLEGASHDNY